MWGVLNKEAPLRLCAYQDWPEATNVELKVSLVMLRLAAATSALSMGKAC